jgi:UDP-N-acetyl-D-mannosaminuronic acid dehydrogenase
MHNFQKVVVLGLGYIGLPTAALIASRGMKVLGVDTKEDVVKTVASGAIHIAEPDLDGLVQKVVANGMLSAASKPEPADVFIIAVPTPIDDTNKPDLTSVMAAVDSIVELIVPGNLIILESTSPVGTTERIAKLVGERRPDLRIGMNGKAERAFISVAYCPERVLPGRILTLYWRCHGLLLAAGSTLLQNVCPGGVRDDDGAGSRVGETHGKRISRHEYRIRQRAFPHL